MVATYIETELPLDIRVLDNVMSASESPPHKAEPTEYGGVALQRACCRGAKCESTPAGVELGLKYFNTCCGRMKDHTQSPPTHLIRCMQCAA